MKSSCPELRRPGVQADLRAWWEDRFWLHFQPVNEFWKRRRGPNAGYPLSFSQIGLREPQAGHAWGSGALVSRCSGKRAFSEKGTEAF